MAWIYSAWRDYPRMIKDNELRKYIREQLGEGVIQVELTPEQIDHAISDALLMYSRYRPKPVAGTINVQPSVKKYTLPTAVHFLGVMDFQFEPSIPQFQAIEFSILYRSPQTYLYDVQDLAWWQSHLKLVSRIFGFDKTDWKFDETEDGSEQFIYVNIVPQGISRASFIGLLARTLENIPLTDEDLIRRASLSYAMITLSRIRGRYMNIPSPDGIITQNAEQLREDGMRGVQEIELLLRSQDRLVTPSWG